MADLEFLKKADRKHWGDRIEEDRLIQRIMPKAIEKLREEARKSLQVTPIQPEEVKALEPVVEPPVDPEKKDG